jgi:putative ABC transport system substrate-binding protein
MRRRDLLTFLRGAAAASLWPLAGQAQQGGRVRRVGVLLFGAETDDPALEILKELREELKKLGWTEGGNLQLDVRFGGGDFNRTRANAAELVNLAPDAILAITGAAVDAARQQTKTIPIVQVAGDSNERGVVQNVARPEGGRWLELLKEAAPNISRVAYLRRPQSESYGRYIEAAAQRLGMKITTILVSNAAEIRAAIERFAAGPNGGLLPNPGIAAIPRHEWVRLAEQYRLPAIYAASSFAADGGLMSYGSDGIGVVPGVASYIDRILRGAKISDLPVQYPTRFRLVINLKAAKAIGLTIPDSMLLRADQLIE